jgi:hypothetical protein
MVSKLATKLSLKFSRYYLDQLGTETLKQEKIFIAAFRNISTNRFMYD